MAGYIFLDNWVLSDYTKGDKERLLSEFIRRNNYTILINGMSLAELYNPGWRNSGENDRTVRAARFWSRHPCIVVRPEEVFKSETESFPAKLEHPPIKFNLDDLPRQYREPALLSIMRRDSLLLEHGIDIMQWVKDYEEVKSSWLNEAEQIIENACDTGVLTRDENGQFVDLEESKGSFLITLDRRHFDHFSPEEREALGKNRFALFCKTLRAIRFSSLCFWYAYIDTDKAYPPKRKGSDIGDFFQMSLIPYCSAFTADMTMSRLIRRIMDEVQLECQIYDHKELDDTLQL